MLGSVLSTVARATLLDWTVLAAALLGAFYVFGTWTYDFFARRGIASTRPRVPFLGNNLKAFLSMQDVFALVQDIYQEGRGHSVVGFFEFRRPIFMVRDPELLKVVAVKEFDHFMNRRSFGNEKVEPIFSKNLFLLRDEEWREMRAMLTPAFTTSKIKAMFPLISQCGQQMAQFLRTQYDSSPEGAEKLPKETDLKDLFTRMANDVIGTVAFGLSCDSLAHPNNDFYTNGKTITTFSRLTPFIFLGYVLFPKLMTALGVTTLNKKAMRFLDSLVHDTIRERHKRGIHRPDMLQLLMQAREGQLKAEAEDEHETDDLKAMHGKKNLSDNDITAQAVIFFFAGFETVSTVLSFTTVVLSHESDVQSRLQEEVDDVMRKTGGKITYEAVQGMKYLDMVISEGMRLYPAVVAVDRECLEATTLPATLLSGPAAIRKGDIVSVPIYAIHRDAEYWPEPETFDPERFSDENKANIKPFTYMPFGLGPRICIGQRFALLEVKIALVQLLASFDLRPCAKTLYPIQFEKGFNVMAKGGLWCNLVPRAQPAVTPAA